MAHESAVPTGAGAPRDEVEITDEMIDAGVRALRAEYQPYFESEAAGVRKIYSAMTRVAPAMPFSLDRQHR